MSVVFDNVAVSLYTKVRRIDVLKGFNLRVKNREFVVLTGPSGSGKTTILNVIAGAVKVQQGRVLVLNQDVMGMSEDELAKIRTQIGFVFQNYYLFPRFPVWYNVAIPLLLKRISAKKARNQANEILTSLHMNDHINKLAMELSGGEQQRVAIARALANDPPLILADEPTGNLDAENSQLVQEIFTRLNREGKTIIVATHDLEFVKKAGRVVKI